MRRVEAFIALVVGVAATASPRRLLRVFGIARPEVTGAAALGWRLFGVRTAAIGAAGDHGLPAPRYDPAALEGALAAAAARSASAKTMLELLPPSSSVTRFTWSAQPAMILLPTAVEPVKTILRTSG